MTIIQSQQFINLPIELIQKLLYSVAPLTLIMHRVLHNRLYTIGKSVSTHKATRDFSAQKRNQLFYVNLQQPSALPPNLEIEGLEGEIHWEMM